MPTAHLAPGLTGALNAAYAKPSAATQQAARQAKAWATAQDFEANYMSSMFQDMMTDIDGDGPFGGTTGIGIWRSFLTDALAKSMVQKGGVGIAEQVYRSLLPHQEAAMQPPAGLATAALPRTLATAKGAPLPRRSLPNKVRS